MNVKCKLINPEINTKIPIYSKPGDAGLDFWATSESLTKNVEYGYIEYGTNIAVEIPEGFVGLLFPRSSISETGLILANSVGVVDSGYRGEIKFRFKYIPETKKYKVGERVGQMVIMPYPQVEFELVEELSSTDRGEGGFGSTN